MKKANHGLTYYPMFLKISRKKCVVVGGDGLPGARSGRFLNTAPVLK
jgi:siroheme synthase (precorrin-2 oxidase/ferrochelatase)